MHKNPLYCPDTILAYDRRLCREISEGNRQFRFGVGHLIHKGLAEHDGLYSVKLTQRGVKVVTDQIYSEMARSAGPAMVERAKALFALFPARRSVDGKIVDVPLDWDKQPASARLPFLRAAIKGWFLHPAGPRVYRWRGDGSVYSSLCFVDPYLYGYATGERALGIEQVVAQRKRVYEKRVAEREARAKEQEMIKQSKFLSLILRHNPEAGKLTLDAEGWAKVSDVLAAVRSKFGNFSRSDLDRLVAENDKKRFALNAHGDKIRANQGHSVAVDLKLEPQQPPERLFHGTKQKNIGLIFKDGLKPGSRQHVHLSKDVETAYVVAGRRRGDDVILIVHAKKLADDGHTFYCSENGVWLTDTVPPAYLEISAEGQE